jgi:16S rRNA processing protein RimM
MATQPPFSADRAADEAPTLPTDAVEVGWIVGAWGVKGGFKVQPHASDPQALFSSRRWFVLKVPGAVSMPASLRLLRITQAREHGGAVVAMAQEVADRAAAEALHGARVLVSRASFPTAGDNEYYWVDLIGLSVVNRDGVTLGQVTHLIDTGAHSVLCVRPSDAAADAVPAQSERLIPFVAAYIDAVDLAARQIRVDWGLDY